MDGLAEGAHVLTGDGVVVAHFQYDCEERLANFLLANQKSNFHVILVENGCARFLTQHQPISEANSP